MRRFFIPADSIRKERARIGGTDFHHLVHVLRKSSGDTIDAVDGWGNFLKIRIDKVEAGAAEGTILERIPATERKISVTLYQAIPRQGIFDDIVEKAVELGVRRIVPLVTARSTVRFDDERGEKKLARWRRIADETIKRVGRADSVEILPVIALPAAHECLIEGSLKLAAWEMEQDVTLKSILHEENNLSAAEVLIGPEGGLSEEEIWILKEMGFRTVSLGKRILRVETAAVSVLSNIFYELDL
ncbi:MAG: hypothetical protein A2Y33_08975 [Spirochaetes bacterium GWF1_51_8]|nr:MAG: hypothetical protein A2Y33_08975 [Spirochaetes bacterium GWF1_51_8]